SNVDPLPLAPKSRTLNVVGAAWALPAWTATRRTAAPARPANVAARRFDMVRPSLRRDLARRERRSCSKHRVAARPAQGGFPPGTNRYGTSAASPGAVAPTVPANASATTMRPTTMSFQNARDAYATAL